MDYIAWYKAQGIYNRVKELSPHTNINHELDCLFSFSDSDEEHRYWYGILNRQKIDKDKGWKPKGIYLGGE